MSFQALRLDFMCLPPSFALESIPLGWGGTDLLHSCRKFPTDVNCIFKATFPAEPQLQLILSSSLQLLPVPMPVLQAESIFAA